MSHLVWVEHEVGRGPSCVTLRVRTLFEAEEPRRNVERRMAGVHLHLRTLPRREWISGEGQEAGRPAE